MAGFKISNKDNTEVLLAGGGSKAISSLAVGWSSITDKPINFKSYSGSLSTEGWKTMNGKANSPSIAISYNNDAANWNSGKYSASLVFGCSDTRGLLDCAYSTPIVTFGGCAYGASTDNDPTWYMKISGTSGAIYNLNNFALSTSLNSYLPLSGGTLTGNLTIKKSDPRIHFYHSDTYISDIGANTTYGLWILNRYNTSSWESHYINLKDQLYFDNKYPFIHSGNISSYAITSHQSLANYLPLSGGTMTGAAPISFTVNKIALNFRGPNYKTDILYMTYGNEALVFSTQQPVTSFIFKSGLSLSDGNDWNTVFANSTPTLLLKGQSAYINGFLSHNVSPAYNLYVGGTSYFSSTINAGSNITWSSDSGNESGGWNILTSNYGLKILNTTVANSQGNVAAYATGLHVSGTYWYLISYERSDERLHWRGGNNEGVKNGGWKTIIDSGNISSYALTGWRIADALGAGGAPITTSVSSTRITDSYYVLATTSSGSCAWYKLPSNAFLNDNTNTTYSPGTGLSLDGTTFNAKLATNALLGVTKYVKYYSAASVKRYNGDVGGSEVDTSTTANIELAYASSTSGRFYPVLVDKNGFPFVNIPWSDTNTTYTFTTSGSGNVLTGVSTSGTTITFTKGNVSSGSTYGVASTSSSGLAPQLSLDSTNTIASQSTDYVLTYKSGTNTTPVWRKLPTNAFLNDNSWREIYIDGLSISSNSLNLKHGTNISLSRSGGDVTITASTQFLVVSSLPSGSSITSGVLYLVTT